MIRYIVCLISLLPSFASVLSAHSISATGIMLMSTMIFGFASAGAETKNDEDLVKLVWAIHLTGLFVVIGFYNLG